MSLYINAIKTRKHSDAKTKAVIYHSISNKTADIIMMPRIQAIMVFISYFLVNTYATKLMVFLKELFVFYKVMNCMKSAKNSVKY